MPANRQLLRAMVGIAIGYLFLLAALLTWSYLEGPPYEAATPARLVGIGLCTAMVGLLTFAAAMFSLNWPKRFAGLLVGAAAVAALLIGLFDWPAFFLWQFLIELCVQMVFQVGVLVGANWLGYGFVNVRSQLETADGATRPMRLSMRDLFLLMTSFALLFAALRPLEASTQPGWFSWPLLACGVLLGTIGLLTIWGGLSNAHLALRCLILLLPGPLAAVGFWITNHLHGGWLLHNAGWYACGAIVQMLFMVLPLLVLRRNGYRIGHSKTSAF
jgi:hypothetical protein